MMNKKTNQYKIPLLPVVSILLILFAVVTVIVMKQTETPDVVDPTLGTTEPVEEFTVSPETIPVSDGTDALDLGRDLKLHSFNSYTGMYMEDGSDEILTGVAMAILTNESKSDLQYAKFTVTYDDEVCTYIVTNLPAGASAVLLEQERKDLPDGEPVSTQMENVAFFETPMNPYSECFEISGMDGVMNVKNISGADIAGDIYVYYKYSSTDLFYGGITFRIRIEGGLTAGNIYQSVTAHFNPARCTIVDIVYAGA